MSLTLAFDVYGTLIDTQGIAAKLKDFIGEDAVLFAKRWRDRQLEYTFRRGLMQNYQPFNICTRQALDATCFYFGHDLSGDQRDDLMDLYTQLPAFPEVAEALSDVRRAGHHLFAFSNGLPAQVDELLTNAGIRSHFEAIVSVDPTRTFKPAPAVYAHFMREAGARADQSWLISSNTFDVCGALSAGMHAAWVRRRTDFHFDPWELQPDIEIAALDQLLSVLPQGRSI